MRTNRKKFRWPLLRRRARLRQKNLRIESVVCGPIDRVVSIGGVFRPRHKTPHRKRGFLPGNRNAFAPRGFHESRRPKPIKWERPQLGQEIVGLFRRRGGFFGHSGGVPMSKWCRNRATRNLTLSESLSSMDLRIDAARKLHLHTPMFPPIADLQQKTQKSRCRVTRQGGIGLERTLTARFQGCGDHRGPNSRATGAITPG